MKKEKVPKKMGRPPASDPINHNIKIGLNEELFNKVQEYTEKNNCSTAEMVRRALKMLFKKEKIWYNKTYTKSRW